MNNSRCVDLDQPMSFATEAPVGFGRKLQRIVAALGEIIIGWQERAASRAHLATLDDHMLRDVGLSRADVEREVSLPFWRQS